MSYDLVIRNGTIVDGLGGEPFVGDVAVFSGVITAVGTVDGEGAREIDATGLRVSPMEEAYDRLLDEDGHAMLLVAMANYENNSLDTVGQLLRRGHVATIVSGEMIAENGVPTDARPGKLIRGRQAAPAA